MDIIENENKKAAPENIHTDENSARNHWRSRLSALSEAEQRRISKKYYGGAMPWKQA
ncbi:MAG: hypothetical protein ACI4JF_10010 [Oscillospiraceae bacterium]